MEYDMILPAVTGASGVFAGCAVLYSKLRPHFPVKVNCWFCNKDTKVAFRLRESWYCPTCQQYNGFTEDGDYNRDLPAQYCESLNVTSRQHSGTSKESEGHSTLALGNGFCQTCNLNQALKVRALADYTPIHPDNYDTEIEDYRKRLEKTYTLCRACEATLHQTLGKQDSWLKPKLISWRLKMTAENKAQVVVNLCKGYQGASSLVLHFLRFVVLLISLSLFLCNLHHLQEDSGRRLVELDLGLGLEQHLGALHKFSSALTIGGLSIVLLIIFGAGKETLLVSDAITSFSWVGLLALCSSKQLLSTKDYNSLQVLVSGVVVLFTVWMSLASRSINRMKLMTRQNLNKSGMNDLSASKLVDSQSTLNASFSEELHCPSPPQTPQAVNEVPASTHHLYTDSPVMDDNTDTALGLDATLGSLKISTPLKANSRNTLGTPTISPRLLFSDKPGFSPKLNGSYCIQKNMVSPPRLSAKNVTQSSWVAGGYWGHPVSPSRDISSHHVMPLFSQIPSSHTHLYPLSRSSSQSSGFVSQSSGPTSYRTQGPCSLPNSRHGSHYGDYDCGSVLSEPTYKSWGAVPNLYPSDSVSQCSRSQHRRQSKGDAQSLHSCSSAYSDCSLRYNPPSPIGNSSTLNQAACGSLSNTSSNDCHVGNGFIVNGGDASVKSLRSTKYDQRLSFSYRNPWFAFFLGMSFAANGFLVALLYMRADIQMFFSS